MQERGRTDIFETHAHYDDEAFDEDREELLASLPEKGIGRVVDVGASLASSRKAVELAERYEYVYCTVGVHPSETAELDEESFRRLGEAASHPKCVAVGEIGLDYYWDTPEREVQKAWFGRQLELARDIGKPVVIHSREAAAETIELMREHRAEEIGGVIHCFSYTKETAQIFLDMGFYIGIGGVLTFQNSKKLKEAAAYIPLERIVLETDSPYLAPVPFRGKRNSSLNLPYVAEKLAELKGVSVEEVCRATWQNAVRLYRL